MPPIKEPQRALGEALRRLRPSRGMSQMDLARSADLHPTWISHLESGDHNPTWATIRRIVAALDARMSDLIQLVEEIEGERSS